MATHKNNAPAPQADESFHNLYGEYGAELAALRCISSGLDAGEDAKDAEQIASAIWALQASVARLDGLHLQLDTWHTRATAQSAPIDAMRPRESIQGRPLEDALDEQRFRLWEAEATILSIAQALEMQYGRDWPAGIPNYPTALRAAARTVEVAADDLEAAMLEDRAAAIRRAKAAA